MSKCRHDIAEDCPACMQEAIDTLLAQIAEWIAYADKLERVLEVVCGQSTDELKKLHAKQGLELVRPDLAVVGGSIDPK